MRQRRRAIAAVLLAAGLGVGGLAVTGAFPLHALTALIAARGLVARAAPPPGVELPAGPRSAHPGVAEPDPQLTPGAVLPDATPGRICRAGYARGERHVTISLKRQVLRAYRVRYVPGHFTVDHLVPLELGGANLGRDPRSGRVLATANLWPQPNHLRANAALKDRLENHLHDEVCAGRIRLRTAQLEIAHDWYGTWLESGRP